MRRVYDALKTTEPQTPNEVALALEMNQKTVQSILLELANTKDDVKWEKNRTIQGVLAVIPRCSTENYFMRQNKLVT
jgi:hypothetical protein